MCFRRCLGFFEGGKGSSVGDVAYRITVEASDMADTVYVILNVCILAMFCEIYVYVCVIWYESSNFGIYGAFGISYVN